MSLTLDIDVDPAWGQDEDWEAVAARAARATGKVAPEIAGANMLVSLVFADDAEVHALNRQWRARDKPTNVLSFPMLDRAEVLRAANGPDEPVMLGDIVLARETCLRESQEKAIAFASHATHLIVHGLLHLAGYDHEGCDAQAEEMEALEVRALAELGIADPYECGSARD